MHASSLENMQKCYRRFIRGSALESKEKVLVLDIGGADVNGNYRDVFEDPPFSYVACDLSPGEGVDLVLDDPYRIPMDDASVDIVLSGQMLEHCEFFWLAVAEMVRILKPDGFLFLIAPSAGPIHPYPVDCYRFYPDAYKALAKYAQCQLIDLWHDERGPWKDLVGVFRRHGAPNWRLSEKSTRPSSSPPKDIPAGSTEEEKVQGKIPFHTVLSLIHEGLQPSLYLEIGVRSGHSLELAKCQAIGVDPSPEITRPLQSSARIMEMTSDEFFDEHAGDALKGAPDLVFIDGMHLFEYALRDLMNAERFCSPASLVVFDDVFPSHPVQASRSRRTHVWMGDVWKILPCLKRYRPDLFIQAIDASPSALLLVSGLNAKNKVLWDQYNSIVRANVQNNEPLPQDIIERVDVLAADGPELGRIIAALKELRGSSANSPKTVVQRLRIAAQAGPVK